MAHLGEGDSRLNTRWKVAVGEAWLKSKGVEGNAHTALDSLRDGYGSATIGRFGQITFYL